MLLDALFAVTRIDDAQERSPLLVAHAGADVVHHRCPSRFGRDPIESQSRLLRGASTLAAIAIHTTAHDVFPRSSPTQCSRDHMVEVQLGSMGLLAAVLAGELVSREDVRAAVSNVPFRNTIEAGQQDDAWNRNLTARSAHAFCTRRHARPAPLFEIEGLVLWVHHACDVHVDQRKCATNRCHVNRQKRTIEYENARIQHVDRTPC